MISAENKKLAHHTASALGGTPAVNDYNHDSLPLKVALLSCQNRPHAGLTAYATLGLSDHPMKDRDGKEFPIRIELVGACDSTAVHFPNIIASAAFHIMRNRQFYAPGTVVGSYVAEYYPGTTVPHLYLTAPFLWEAELKTLKLDTKTVTWLLAMPISDGEAHYLANNGDQKLEEVLERAKIDIYDLRRKSAA